MENLIGRKIRGFNTGLIRTDEEYIGEIGEIVDFDKANVSVKFEDGQHWYYPKEEALKHLVYDVVEGKCYTATRHNIELCFISDKVDDISVWNKGSMLDISDGIIDNCVGFFNFEDFIITETPERLPWLEYCIKENKYIPEEEFNSLCNQPISGILQIEDKKEIPILNIEPVTMGMPKKEFIQFDLPKKEEVKSLQFAWFKNKNQAKYQRRILLNDLGEMVVNRYAVVYKSDEIDYQENRPYRIAYFEEMREKQTKRMTLNEALNILADKLGVDEIEIID